MMKRLILAAISCLAAGSLAGASAQTETPEWLTCPANLQLDLRPESTREPARIREIAPSAGAEVSDELAELASLPRLAYELYDVFDKGGDLGARFEQSGLSLVGFIYGDPGRNSERPGPSQRDRDSRTFYGFVADNPVSGERVIVFRGTLQPNEWARNLQATQRAFSRGTRGARVHKGFMAIYESLELEEGGEVYPLPEALPRLTGETETLFVGHSLGSAIATLAGVDAAQRAPQRAGQMRIVTYASPRVGDDAFAALASSVGRIDRVCNQVDVVTAVPPSTRKISYVHVGDVFALSSFDWPDLDNEIEAAGEQVLCWHSDRNYEFMLTRDKDPSRLDTCTK